MSRESMHEVVAPNEKAMQQNLQYHAAPPLPADHSSAFNFCIDLLCWYIVVL